jgi:hypothetical protein
MLPLAVWRSSLSLLLATGAAGRSRLIHRCVPLFQQTPGIDVLFIGVVSPRRCWLPYQMPLIVQCTDLIDDALALLCACLQADLAFSMAGSEAALSTPPVQVPIP